MGTINHNAILATTWDEKEADAFETWLGDAEFARSAADNLNRYCTFFIPPDGSKEGWPESDEGDVWRTKIKEWLNSRAYEDHSSPWDWVEVGYGEYGQKVVAGNCENMMSDRPYHLDK